MEKKTLGAFIAALRKANGMTQRQLAEKLNVSDKAVSRWERDEAMPDLSLIPVLAEVFGVTADELLRGERKSAETLSAGAKPKSEKQRRRLIASMLSKYRVRTTVSTGIAVLGLIVAMICNFAFTRAYLGFMLGCIFYAGSVICQICFLIPALSGLDADMFKEQELHNYRKTVIHLAAVPASTALILFALSLPLILVAWDAYIGLTFTVWFSRGLLLAAAAAAAAWFGIWCVDAWAAKKGLYPAKPVSPALKKLRKAVLKAAVAVLLVTFICHVIIFSIPTEVFADAFVGNHTFTDWDSFRSFMETSVTEDPGIVPPGQSQVVIQPEVPEYFVDTIEPYEPFIETVKAMDGTVLCSFRPLNESVSTIVYGDSEDRLPVIVYTTAQYKTAATIEQNINTAFGILYIAELIAATAIYHVRKRKIA